jgi:hypothetical protein
MGGEQARNSSLPAEARRAAIELRRSVAMPWAVGTHKTCSGRDGFGHELVPQGRGTFGQRLHQPQLIGLLGLETVIVNGEELTVQADGEIVAAK